MLCWAGRLQRRRRSMYAYVWRRARRPNEQSRATTGERSRERPSRPLLAQELARRSLARHQPRSLNEVTAHHARLHCSFWQHMEASEALRWAARAQKDRVWRDFPVFGRDSPREERSTLASPSSSPSRTRPPLHPLSAHDGAQGPIDGGCTHSSVCCGGGVGVCAGRLGRDRSDADRLHASCPEGYDLRPGTPLVSGWPKGQ
jgi:hypothetical protein